jgi:hypothetical protein
VAIYFKGGDSPDITNIEELIKNGFYGTSYFLSHQFEQTYFDSEYKELECKAARRSFTALVEICQTYFPETTEEDVAKVLVKLISGKEDSYLACGFCSTINKVVFCKQYSEFLKPGISSWGNINATTREGEDGISFNQILKLADYQLTNN